MKQRLLLSLLSILAIVYFALPRLPMEGGTAAVAFTWIWLGFAFVAFGGNLAGLLYGQKKDREEGRRKKVEKIRTRTYGRGTGV